MFHTLVEHDMKFVTDLCDRICAISFGKLLAIGTPEEIKTNEKVQTAYLGKEEEDYAWNSFKHWNLKVNYGNIEALKGISMSVEDGQIVALLGSNGAGKTTTLRKISGILDAVEGQIKFFLVMILRQCLQTK